MGNLHPNHISLKKVAWIGFALGYTVPAILYLAHADEISGQKQVVTDQGALCDIVQSGVNSGKVTELSFGDMELTIQPKKNNSTQTGRLPAENKRRTSFYISDSPI